MQGRHVINVSKDCRSEIMPPWFHFSNVVDRADLPSLHNASLKKEKGLFVVRWKKGLLISKATS